MTNPSVLILDDLHPEDVCMLQALYSRSAESVRVHLEKVHLAGSGKFMQQTYVGYGHKSIADCGSTTVFIEDVSILAAKAIQDWPLYSGQETSTRYIDFVNRPIINPVGSEEAASIQRAWLDFYVSAQQETADYVRLRHPQKEGEKDEVYERAIKARTFDSLRGFLPAGITTQLSWHTNLRQAADHLNVLMHHPAAELRDLARQIRSSLALKYPSSGFSSNSIAGVSGVGNKDDQGINRAAWTARVGEELTYQPVRGMDKAKDWGDGVILWHSLNMYELAYYGELLRDRPKGCVLPHFMSDFGQLHWSFLLDFGSFRDIQRQRNGVCRMPLLTSDYGFEDWYLNQLPMNLRLRAINLIENLTRQTEQLVTSDVERQYYLPLGYRVPCNLMYCLPASVYVLELRSGKMIHPTLRTKIQLMIKEFNRHVSSVPLHVDTDPDDWDVRRGTQTITIKNVVLKDSE